MIEALWLVHPERTVCDTFRKRFTGLPGVRVFQARFEDLDSHDCFVTSGNAFGLMTDGIDAAVIRRFGTSLMKRIQDRIMKDYMGEQPVGTAFVVPTGDPQLPFVVHAPTVRAPVSIVATDKVYVACWAALLAVRAHNHATEQKVRTIAFPAMGTGCGGVSFSEAARQMAVAYRNLLEPLQGLNWDAAKERQKAIYYDGDTQVVR